MHETRGLVMLTYSDDDLARAAELGRETFPDLDTRSRDDRCVIASYTLSERLNECGATPHGDPWYSSSEQRTGMCIALPRSENPELDALIQALAGFGFSVRGSLLTGSDYSWWRSDADSGFAEGRVDDLDLWLREVDAPSVQKGLQALMEDLHPDHIEAGDSRTVYTRLGLAFLREHAHHDKEHDVYRDLALLALTELTFPNELPLSCFQQGVDPVLTEDVFQ